jgi:uncharacterized protein YdeI (YjbR/CyaY-like superfamily)
MEVTQILSFSDRSELRKWLRDNHRIEKECWVVSYVSHKPQWNALKYVDIVEEALCFGWIDSTKKKMPDGRLVQRLSPRRKRSNWTELNKQRCRELENQGLMTDAGREAFLSSFVVDYDRV